MQTARIPTMEPGSNRMPGVWPGMGVSEAADTAGLVALGVPDSAAMATAIAFRLVTFYLPPIWGGFAMRWLRRNSYVQRGVAGRRKRIAGSIRCTRGLSFAGEPHPLPGRTSVFFRLNTWELGFILFATVFGATALGMFIGRRLHHRSEALREPFAVLQAALLGVVGLILAFGLALAVGRYESRRQAVVDDANAIGTTYLRAQTLAEPMRSRSIELLQRYTDASIALSETVPGSAESLAAIALESRIQRGLWRLDGQALVQAPTDTAPRLYEEALNAMIDMQTVRVAALSNRVPGAVLFLEVAGASFALGLLAAYLAILGRGFVVVLIGAALVTMLLLVTFDLDRPTRGLIRVPDTALVSLRASMQLPPAASGP
jgi:hypothetical protein